MLQSDGGVPTAPLEAPVAENEQEEVRARSFWSGTITFGLVSIPVELFPANRSQGVSLRMVSEDGTPLARRYFCPKEGRELDWEEIVRGYEIEKDRFVVVTDEELERLAPEKTRDIDLRRFVDAAEIDPIYFERAYYLTPGGNSTKAYRLLAETMERTNRAGIATFVMRGKEYLVAILAENGIMRAETLRFADEVRAADEVGLPEPDKPPAAAVRKMEKAIAKLVEKELDEDELTDHSSEKLLELVAKKEKSGEGVVAAPEGIAEPSEGVIDLMEVLKRSLEGKASSKAAGSERSAGAKSSGSKAKKRSATTKSSGTKSSGKKSSGKKSTGTKAAAKKSAAKKKPAAKKKSAARKKSSAKKPAAKSPSKTARKGAKSAPGAKSKSGRKTA